MDKEFRKVEKETEVPGNGATQVVILIVIMVPVDIETIRIEIADINAVHGRIRYCPCSSIATNHRKIFLQFVFYSEAGSKNISHLHQVRTRSSVSAKSRSLCDP